MSFFLLSWGSPYFLFDFMFQCWFGVNYEKLFGQTKAISLIYLLNQLKVYKSLNNFDTLFPRLNKMKIKKYVSKDNFSLVLQETYRMRRS